MGCDIHLQIEIKKKGKWYWANEFLPKGLDKHDYIPLDRGRNYKLFAVLADVRNDWDIVPISKPRGLPEDISEALKSEADNLLGDHSWSWLTADELENYDWEKIIKINGVVNSKQYKSFKLRGSPEEWCKSVGGGMVRYVSNDEMENLIKLNMATDNHYTQISWEKSIVDAVSFETYYQYKNLRNLISWEDDGKEIEDIRIVFGFDS